MPGDTGATARLVSYLAPDVLELVPPDLRADWPAEESCTSIEVHLTTIETPRERELIMAEVREFEADALCVVRRDLLPHGELWRHTYLDPGGGFVIYGEHNGVKVRVDQRMNLAVMRTRPIDVDPERPRLLQLRHELGDVLSIPLASPNRKPVRPAVVIDLAEREPGAVYVELDPPTGSGFAFGRFSELRAYSDGKVLLVAFSPNTLVTGPPREGPPGTADPNDPRFDVDTTPDEPPPSGSPGTGPPPRRGSDDWTDEDETRAEANLAVQQQQAALAGAGAAGAGAGGGGAGAGAGGAGRGAGKASASAEGGRGDEGKGAGEDAGGPAGEDGGPDAGKGQPGAEAGAEDTAAGDPDAEAGGAFDDEDAGGAGRSVAEAADDLEPGLPAPGADAPLMGEEPQLRLDDQGDLADDGLSLDDWNAGRA